MAAEAAWLNGNKLTERRKSKCALTSTGLLMEGLCSLPDFTARLPFQIRGGLRIMVAARSQEGTGMKRIALLVPLVLGFAADHAAAQDFARRLLSLCVAPFGFCV